MDLRGKISNDIDFIWENSSVFNSSNARMMMTLLELKLPGWMKENGGQFPQVGDTFIEIAHKFEVTKVRKKQYYNDEGKSEITLKYLGKDAEEEERLRKEEEERNKPKGEIDEGVYSRVLDEDKYPKIRVSFYPDNNIVEHFKHDSPIKTMDFLSTLFGYCLQTYYEEYKNFPSPGEILFNSSRTLYFEVKKRYFMSPIFLESRKNDKPEETEFKQNSKWTVGLFIKIEQCEKDLDILKPILKKSIDINLNLN